jgi:hypothetical protein
MLKEGLMPYTFRIMQCKNLTNHQPPPFIGHRSSLWIKQVFFSFAFEKGECGFP